MTPSTKQYEFVVYTLLRNKFHSVLVIFNSKEDQRTVGLLSSICQIKLLLLASSLNGVISSGMVSHSYKMKQSVLTA